MRGGDATDLPSPPRPPYNRSGTRFADGQAHPARAGLPMRIVILSRQPELYSTKALAAAGERRGHEVRVLDTLQFDIRIRRRSPELLYQGQPVGPVDAVIPRIGASITFYGL